MYGVGGRSIKPYGTYLLQNNPELHTYFLRSSCAGRRCIPSVFGGDVFPKNSM